MNIEQALKYCEVLEDYYTDETYSLSEFINSQQSRINKLEADKLEAYRAILIDYIPHGLMDKAEKYISEVEG